MLNFRRLLHRGSQYVDLFPEKFFQKKYKIPPQLYVADDQLADQINNAIEPFLQQTKCDTAVEINPGIGLFTRKLLNREDHIRKIVLIEALEHFLPGLQELHTLYPERVKVNHSDFVSIWKIAFQDRMDNGTRLFDMLLNVPKCEYKDNENALLFGAVSSNNFFKHLIHSIIFQNGLFNWGRFEMYLVLPPPIYIHLTCTKEIGYLIYRSTSILFQMMFEYRFITRLPREHFLPNYIENNSQKGSRLLKVKSINPEYLYLVRIVPRRNFFDLCPMEDVQALWYFVKQNCVSRRNRIIPNIEKWVPGCGPRLIINNATPETLLPLYPDEDQTQLPKYSTRCTTMSNRNYFQRMTIYTQFGELTPSQMLTLFTQFRHWPEYSESSFLASLDNTLLKMETAADDNVDVAVIAEEDDIGSDIANEGVALKEIKRATDHNTVTCKKRKRKATTSN